MKGVGVCLLVAAGCAVGCLRAAALRGRVAALGTVLRFIDWWMRELKYTAAPVDRLLTRAKADPQFSDILSQSGKVAGFTEEDGRCFEQFTAGLGMTDLEGQITHGTFHIKVFEERLKEAETRMTDRGRMEMMLWTGGAAIVALLLL